MGTPAVCSECGASLTAEQAQAEVCPRCAMRLVLGDTGDGGTSREIGPYVVIRSIGEGGMGEVFLAEQREPIQRRVALKVIKQGMDTKHVVARFEAERQALALMDHASIAKVFDAGATPEGRPFFVMEYVEGEPITSYADRGRLSLRARLHLFGKVCAGVQHAHQKGVIHRDLKPSNVLVTEQDGEALPKIIDFGVAKAISKRLTEQSLFTEFGIMIGTPEYMSPEQAEVSALDIDTRTDVYSLGVILYELLTGALPFNPAELRRAGHEEIRRRIREEEPATPSSRVSTLDERATDAAHTRRVEPSILRRELQGDLDWIVLKALAKDRDRRYSSPAEFAVDIERHLTDEPVVARPPSAAYKARKFVRRNRLLVSSAAVVLLTLIAGIAGTTTFGLREARQRRATDSALADLEQVVGFQQTMLADIDVQVMGNRLVERLRRLAGAEKVDEEDVRRAGEALERAFRDINTTDAARGVLDEEILGRAAIAVGEQFGDQPAVAARLRRQIGWTYFRLGLLDQAKEQLEQAVAIYRETIGFRTRRPIGTLRNLGLTYFQRGNYAEAEPIFVEVLELSREVLGEKDRDTAGSMTNLGLLYYRTDRLEESAGLHEAALAVSREVAGPDSVDSLKIMGHLANTFDGLGRFAEAEELYREAAEGLRRVSGEDSEELLLTMANLASCVKEQGRMEEAEILYEDSLANMKRVLGATHRHTVTQATNLASLYLDRGEYTRADALYRKLLDDLRERGALDAQTELQVRMNLGISLSNQNRFAEAATELEPALEELRAMLGENHPHALLMLQLLDQAYWSSDQTEQGRDTAYELMAIAREDPSRFRDAHWKTVLAFKLLYWDEEPSDPELALRLALEANELGEYAVLNHLKILAQAYFETGDFENAVLHQRKALTVLPPDDAARPTLESVLAQYVKALEGGVQ